MKGGPPLLVAGMEGLGDSLYQRPFVRELARTYDVFVKTPWPQLYGDLGVTCLRTSTPLRTQSRNEGESAAFYGKPTYNRINLKTARVGHKVPRRERRLVTYTAAVCRGETMWAGFVESFQCTPAIGLDFPPLPPSPVRSTKPICLVRPVTMRTEWLNLSRNPLPMHVADIVHWLRAEGMHVVSVADLAQDKEWAVDPMPEADEQFHAGELGPLELFALVQASSAVVGGVGWIVPAAIAAHVPAFIILGGQGGYNAPALITDPSMDTGLMGWGVPDDFCGCTAMQHECAKRNSQLRPQYDEWRLRCAGGWRTALVA